MVTMRFAKENRRENRSSHGEWISWINIVTYSREQHKVQSILCILKKNIRL
jgi:hypothetical protein